MDLVFINNNILGNNFGIITIPDFGSLFKFDPALLSGANNSNITGQDNLTQSNTARQPKLKTSVLNGFNVAEFDGVNDCLDSTITTNYTNFSVIVVARSFDFLNFQVIFGKVSGDSYNILQTSGQPYVQGSNLVVAATALTANTWQIYGVDVTGLNVTYYLNNVTNGTGNLVSRPSSTNIWQLSSAIGVLGTFKGQIAYSVFYPFNLTSGERTNIYNALKSKYNL